MGEADRKMLKAVIKHSSGEDQVRHRQVPQEVVIKWSQKLESLKREISDVLQEEKEEKQVRARDGHWSKHNHPYTCLDRFAKQRWS